jgi:hypothetical protein
MARSGSKSDKTVGVVACPGLEQGADESFGRHGESLPYHGRREEFPSSAEHIHLGVLAR